MDFIHSSSLGISSLLIRILDAPFPLLLGICAQSTVPIISVSQPSGSDARGRSPDQEESAAFLRGEGTVQPGDEEMEERSVILSLLPEITMKQFRANGF